MVKKETPFLLLLCIISSIIILVSFHVIRNYHRDPIPFETAAPQQPSDARIDLNSATVEELNALPGISKTIARRIVAYRENNGIFENIGQLLQIQGITPTIIDEISPYIKIGDPL